MKKLSIYFSIFFMLFFSTLSSSFAEGSCVSFIKNNGQEVFFDLDEEILINSDDYFEAKIKTKKDFLNMLDLLRENKVPSSIYFSLANDIDLEFTNPAPGPGILKCFSCEEYTIKNVCFNKDYMFFPYTKLGDKCVYIIGGIRMEGKPSPKEETYFPSCASFIPSDRVLLRASHSCSSLM